MLGLLIKPSGQSCLNGMAVLHTMDDLLSTHGLLRDGDTKDEPAPAEDEEVRVFLIICGLCLLYFINTCAFQWQEIVHAGLLSACRTFTFLNVSQCDMHGSKSYRYIHLSNTWLWAAPRGVPSDLPRRVLPISMQVLKSKSGEGIGFANLQGQPNSDQSKQGFLSLIPSQCACALGSMGQRVPAAHVRCVRLSLDLRKQQLGQLDLAQDMV